MDKNGIVTFSDWNKGMVKHPIYGFGLLKNVEVFENKGIAKIKNVLSEDTGFSTTGLPVAKVDGYVLSVSSSGGFFSYNGSTITSSLTNPWDIIRYKGYIFVRHGANLSAYGLEATSPQWFPNILTSFNSNFYGKLLVGQDDFLYATNGNEVVKLSVTASAPGVAPVVTISATLDLPDGQYATTIEEYGTNIIIGTQTSASFYSQDSEQKCKLFAWNRQAGTLGNPGLADLPILFKEGRINAILSHQNKLYVSAGSQGNIYVTDSTNYQQITSLPFTQKAYSQKSNVYPNAMIISSNGNLLVGVGSNNSAATNGVFGIYEIDINSTGYPVSMRSIYGNTTTSDLSISIGFIAEYLESNYLSLYVGFGVGSTYKIYVTSSGVNESIIGVIETPMIKVGGYNSKKSFQHIEWCLAEPLLTSQTISIYSRKNNKEDYVLVNTWTYATLGSVISFEDIAGIADCEYIQLKIEMTNSSLNGGSESNNINLISVRLW